MIEPAALRRGRRLRLALLVVVVVAGAVADLSRAPQRQLGTHAALSLIEAYQAIGSDRVAATGVRCRFQPTCSHFGHAVFSHHGWWRGGWMTLGRILRCGPWTPAGTDDPPIPDDGAPS